MVENPIRDMKMMENRRFSLDFFTAILLTIVLITIYRLEIHISIPFVNYEAYKER